MSPVAALLALALAIPDLPYVRSKADSSDPNSHCLWWPVGTITYQQVTRGNPETLPAGSEFTAVHKSFDTWQAVMNSCGDLTLVEGPRIADRTIGHNPGSTDNHNTVVFRQAYCAGGVVPPSDSCWTDETCMNVYDCWEWGRGTIALTTTTYERASGRVYDSDIELNAYYNIFTTNDAAPCSPPDFSQTCSATDVQNTVTHEAGHVLGMDHTARAGSTMNTSAVVGEMSKRVVDPGSASFVCEVYPKGRQSRDCVINPVPNPLGPVVAGSCGAAGGGLTLSALAGLVGLGRRRRKLAL